MATIICQCEAVQIEFHTNSNLFRLECCCYDCTAALWYANKRGGPAFPALQCVDSCWFPNDFRVVKGLDKLGAFMNFENADTTRFHCTSCWSVLFGDHTAYAGKIVVTQVGSYKEFGGLTHAALMPPQARHFLKDLAPDQLAALPPWGGDPMHVYQGVAENWMARFPAVLEAGKEGAGMNAQILLGKIGDPFIPTGDRRLSGGPPTLMQQLASQAAGPA